MNTALHRWYTVMVFQLAGLVVAWYFGALQLIFEADVTKISAVIGIIWVLATLQFLADFRHAAKPENKDCPFAYSINHSRLKFYQEASVILGLIGTVIGMYMMSKTVNLDNMTLDSMKGSIGEMLVGFGVAFLTTLAGQCSMLSIKLMLTVADDE